MVALGGAVPSTPTGVLQHANATNATRTVFGGQDQWGLEREPGADFSDPYGAPKKYMFFHYFSDANLDGRSVSGGVGDGGSF